MTTPQIANPHDAHRIAGGSSGGSAACVAAGFATAALGTDTGGSIRIPAALCGVVGVRPTHARIAMTGITPLAPSQDTVGPMAGDVATCAAVLEVLLGRSLHRPDEDLATLRVGVLADPGDLDEQTGSAFRTTVTNLASTGVEIVEVDAALNRSSGALSLLTMLAESAQLHAGRVLETPHAFGGEARALLTLGVELAESRDVLDAARVALVGRTAGLMSGQALDAVLTPTTPCVAPPRGALAVPLGLRQVPVATALTRYTAWASATGLPALSVPVASNGPPAGMQLMGPADSEATLLLLARAVERTR